MFNKSYVLKQFSGSATLSKSNRSRSAAPYHRTDPDSDRDSAILFSGFNQKYFSSKFILLITFRGYIYILKVFTVIIKPQDCRNQGFSLMFMLVNRRICRIRKFLGLQDPDLRIWI